jgi:hypothetical protein
MDVPRTVDVSALTFAEVQQRALDATARPGHVFHITATSSDLTAAQTQGWVDRERNLGRSEGGAGFFGFAIFHDDRVALVGPGDGRFRDSAITSGLPAGAQSAHAAGYLPPLFAEQHDYIRRELRAGVHDGRPVIVVEMEPEIYESRDTLVTETFLDESFLPVKVDSRRNGSRQSLTYEYEFIPRDTLPDDFFSVEHIRAAATTPLDDMRAARDAGIDPCWLGERFEEMVLRDESAFDTSNTTTSMAALRLSYGPPGDGPVPVPCVSISQHGADAWQQILDLRAENNPAADDNDLELATLALPGAAATIYELPGVKIPPGPMVGIPAEQPQLPAVPDDTGQYLIAVVQLDSGGIIEIMPNCGPVGSNLYRTPDAFMRLVAALRPYAGP